MNETLTPSADDIEAARASLVPGPDAKFSNYLEHPTVKQKEAAALLAQHHLTMADAATEDLAHTVDVLGRNDLAGEIVVQGRIARNYENIAKRL